MASGHGLAGQHGPEELRAIGGEVVVQGRVEWNGDFKVAVGIGIRLDGPLRRRGRCGLCRVSMVRWRHGRLAGIDDERRAVPGGHEGVCLEDLGEGRRSRPVIAASMGQQRGSRCASEQRGPRERHKKQQQQARMATCSGRCCCRTQGAWARLQRAAAVFPRPRHGRFMVKHDGSSRQPRLYTTTSTS